MIGPESEQRRDGEDCCRRHDGGRETHTLSRPLKMMAAERETTIAAIIHEWIQEYLEKEGE